MNSDKTSAPEKRVEKLQIMVADSELAMIDDWRFENRAASRSAAIRSLIYLGLELTKSDPEKVSQLLDQLDRA
ncbi:hypothetical protein [Hyphococcus luteus]|uniref:Uncharacterized protein n=1 Tax=Hyphococcus luteus TaxID=2058213 RepID=A0A2S7KA16_9PROT|nr:hypothetical protein [Marinicaulis flavus]PQA89364.1 hypothetical protein CW354_00360 [Marinicaulis flavus]